MVCTPYAVQDSYGGVDGLKRLVDACHQQGMAVLLDVVYNHFGPEGCYVGDYAPYYQDKYQCLWGSALNFDGAVSYGVRNYFIQNALYWLETFHIDGLRLESGILQRLWYFRATSQSVQARICLLLGLLARSTALAR